MIRQVSWREPEIQRGSAAGVTRRRSAGRNYAGAQQVSPGATTARAVLYVLNEAHLVSPCGYLGYGAEADAKAWVAGGRHLSFKESGCRKMGRVTE
jgi:hypothetical protein